MQPAGMHHVSALSAHIGRTHDFYVRVLGMRPLLRTVNQDDTSMYHLFYGDGAGSVGSDVTVFDLRGAVAERAGNNSITRTGLRVADERSLEYWAARLQAHGVTHGGIVERDALTVLDFADPEGTQLTLVAEAGGGHVWTESTVPAEHQVLGLGHSTLTVPSLAATDAFLRNGLRLTYLRAYENAGHEVHVYAMAERRAQGQVHVAVRPELPRARYGAGGVHHVALRVPEGQELAQWASHLEDLGYANSGVVERHYFRSLYVREPNHVLFELATDGPGFTVDGALDFERLSLPPFLESRRQEIEAKLRPLQGEQR